MTDLHVCFVCTGNICRSPTAEKVFATRLAEAGLTDRVRVSSAGTGGWHEGDPADPRTAATLRRHGYPTDHRAAQVDADHLAADLVVALDRSHLHALRGLGVDAARLRLLRSFTPGADGIDPDGIDADGPDGDLLDVGDPYYGAGDGFETVLGQIEDAMPGLLAWVRSQLD